MNLKEFRDTLLRIDRPEDVLRLADTYLHQMETMGDTFILPKEHAMVKPVLEQYAGDLSGWVKFVKNVRDRLPVTGRQFHEGVQELYRTLVVRKTQIERRARLDAAVSVAVQKKLITNDYVTKQNYANRCTQVWKLRRDKMLEIAAKQCRTGRLSVDERETMLEEFWSNVTEEIENGEVPKP
jgi:hypothetical protein